MTAAYTRVKLRPLLNETRVLDADESDSGVYTCQIKASSGQTSASASVRVLSQVNLKKYLGVIKGGKNRRNAI